MFTNPGHKGFTLIELSVVLVIIGILVGLGSAMIGPMTTFVKVRETRDMQDAAIQSITSWASSRNTVPNAGTGEEGFERVAKNSRDAWGKNMAFIYYSSLRIPPVTKDTICGRRSTPLTLKTYENLTETSSVANVVFAVISAADNTEFTSTLGGAAITSTSVRGLVTTGVIEMHGPNADLVRWVTLDELRSKVGCQGAPLKILNNELPSAKYDQKYSAKIIAEGGSGSYQWKISDALPADIKTNADFGSPGVWSSTPQAFMNITGHPHPSPSQGSYYYLIEARDSADTDNKSSKSFVLTLNPQ